MPPHLVHELVLDRRTQPVLKADRRNEVRLLDVAAHEVRVLAELFHADRAHGELSAQDEREQVEAFPAAVREPVREMDEPFLRLSEMPVHVEDKAVHVVGRLVAVVEKMKPAGSRSIKVFFQARQPFFIFNAELDECGDILHVVHALAVRAALEQPEHRRLARSPTAALSAHPPRAEVRLVAFKLAVMSPLKHKKILFSFCVLIL